MVSLVLLTVGVMLANLRGGGDGASSNMTGILATLGISTLSGFAAVYTEKVIKSQRVERSKEYGLAYMQVQLAAASLLIIGLWAIIADFEKISENGRNTLTPSAPPASLLLPVSLASHGYGDCSASGLWHNFNGTAMLSVFNSALGGLTVAAVLKFADSVRVPSATIPKSLLAYSMHGWSVKSRPRTVVSGLLLACQVLKGYATAISVMLTGILSMFFFGTEVPTLSLKHPCQTNPVVSLCILCHARPQRIS